MKPFFRNSSKGTLLSLIISEVVSHVLRDNIDSDRRSTFSADALSGKVVTDCLVSFLQNFITLPNNCNRRFGTCRMETPNSNPTYPPILPINELMSIAL